MSTWKSVMHHGKVPVTPVFVETTQVSSPSISINFSGGGVLIG